MPTFKCKDMGMDDDFEIHDDNEEELMEMVMLHHEKTHGIKNMSPEMMGKIKKAIVADDNCGATCSDYA
jgi:predicted small metal-binding protein